MSMLRSRSHWSRVPAAVTVLLLASCGGVTPAGTGNPTDGGGDGQAVRGETAAVTVDEGCHQSSAAICHALDTCASILVKALYGDEATCEARLKLSCLTDQNVTGTARTAADLVTCAQAVAGATCPDLIASRLPAACQVKPGPVANGGGCGSDWQCNSTYCSKQGQCGVCAARHDAAGACTVDAGCQPGLVCADSKCVTPGGPAAACDAAKQPCRSDLYCDKSGACATKLGASGSCADTDQACDFTKGVVCNPFNKICEIVGVAKGGDACGIVNKVFTVCVGFNPCPGWSLVQTGTCANPAADGDPCGQPAAGRNCVSPATCDATMNVCRLPSSPTCP